MTNKKRPGRPKSASLKKPVSYKLDPEVIELMEGPNGPYIEKAVRFYAGVAAKLPGIDEDKRAQFVENSIRLYMAVAEGRVKFESIPPQLHEEIFGNKTSL